jgi:cell division protein FtsI/penicillin-binding protein 2
MPSKESPNNNLRILACLFGAIFCRSPLQASTRINFADYSASYQPASSKRIYALFSFFIIVFAAVLFRLAFISLVQGDSLAARAARQHSREIAYYPYGRGDFIDTTGRPITGHPLPCLVVFPQDAAEERKIPAVLGKLTGLSPSLIEGKINTAVKRGQNGVIVKSNLKATEIAAIEKAALPGVYIITLHARYGGNEGLHFLGSLQPGETASQYVGKSGLELRYEAYLRGKNGPSIAVLADERRKQFPGGGLRLLPPRAEDTSHDIILTLNWDFQRLTEKALQGLSGAAVIIDVESGDILAMASSPQINPYDQEKKESTDVFTNKALSYYPPASTFKPLLIAAAMEEGIDLAKDFICCGYYQLPGGRIVKCWNQEGHGEQDLKQALANSCNPYFVDLGLRIGGDILSKYVRLLGLERQRIIGYSLTEFENFTFHGNYPGDIANLSMGENGITLSPLQAASFYALIARGGKDKEARLVKEIRARDGESVLSFPPDSARQLINPRTAAATADILKFAVMNGTGFRARTTITSAGKTGTSQDKGVWFAGFAPAENPRWAAAIYIENGAAGGRESAAVFAEIIESITAISEVNR